MPRSLHRGWPPLVVASILATLASCSGGSSPTPTGGNPGGGTPTAPAPFRLTFPTAGRSVTVVFPNPGTFPYHCEAHQGDGMAGAVIVHASGVDSMVVSVGPGSNRTFNPSSVTIKPGGSVRWVNAGTRNDHTVTSN